MDENQLIINIDQGLDINDILDTPVLNEKQKAIVKHWTDPDCLGVTSDFVVMPSGELACISRYLFTHAITYGLSAMAFEDRWCFHTYADALKGLVHWYNNFESMPEPQGWHRHPSSGRRIFSDKCVYSDRRKGDL